MRSTVRPTCSSQRPICSSAPDSGLPERPSQFPSQSAFAFLTNQLDGAGTPFASISRLWLAFRFCAFVLSEMAKLTGLAGTPFSYRCENIGDHLGALFCTKISFTVDADADGVGFHVALS